MNEKDLLNMDDHWDYQLKMTKITTVEMVLRYRFPKMRLGFLYQCSLDELDEITKVVGTITEEELQKYHHA
ncbi:hypothetical protein SG0102_08440 [Intestinibaculum porci]|uniref:Uncharacterized protein n=1 Tax=Intestinibaculum porci TaxID=2487118 RepID=A0A3G9J427_9FIRM|nr:hypothetical protein [Intestinibaculum porci]BBH25910.1 hypothetical protein SG0102_08440 [Intestinibaculum porci]